MVAKQNLTMYQGSDWRRVLELKNDANELLDLTYYSFSGKAKVSYISQDASFTFDFTIRDQISETGLVDVHVTADATNALTLPKMTKFIYDLEMVKPTGDTQRILEGEVQVFPGVTK